MLLGENFDIDDALSMKSRESSYKLARRRTTSETGADESPEIPKMPLGSVYVFQLIFIPPSSLAVPDDVHVRFGKLYDAFFLQFLDGLDHT